MSSIPHCQRYCLIFCEVAALPTSRRSGWKPGASHRSRGDFPSATWTDEIEFPLLFLLLHFESGEARLPHFSLF
jgi:hypothetical protein